jgi:phage/plasmid primase-like uncharacterized protein
MRIITDSGSKSTIEAERQFLAAMRERDLAPCNGQIIADGQIHRSDVISKGRSGKGDGAYAFFPDGPIPAGWFKNWTDGQGSTSWRLESDRNLNKQEHSELRRKLEEARLASVPQL